MKAHLSFYFLVDPCATKGCSDGCSVVGTIPVCNCNHDDLLRLDGDGLTCGNYKNI